MRPSRRHVGGVVASWSTLWILAFALSAGCTTPRPDATALDASVDEDALSDAGPREPDASSASDVGPRRVHCATRDRLLIDPGDAPARLIWNGETEYDAALNRISRRQWRPDGTPMSLSTFRVDGSTEYQSHDSDADGVVDLLTFCETTTPAPMEQIRTCDTDGDGVVDRRTVTRFADVDGDQPLELRLSTLVGGRLQEDLVRTLRYDGAGRVVSGESRRVAGGPGALGEDTFTVEDSRPESLSMRIQSDGRESVVVSEFEWDAGCYGEQTGPF